MALAFALDFNASCESSGRPKIAGNQNSEPFKDFTGQTGQNEITKFHEKFKFLMIFVVYFYICTVDWWSQISTLQVGIVQIV